MCIMHAIISYEYFEKSSTISLLLSRYCILTVFFSTMPWSLSETSEKLSLKFRLETLHRDRSWRKWFIVKVSNLSVVPILIYGYGKSMFFYIVRTHQQIPMFLFQNRSNWESWNFHNKPFSLRSVSMQSFKPKFQTQFFWCFWESPWHFAKKYRKNAICRQ
jgi:hypothetical protein